MGGVGPNDIHKFYIQEFGIEGGVGYKNVGGVNFLGKGF